MLLSMPLPIGLEEGVYSVERWTLTITAYFVWRGAAHLVLLASMSVCLSVCHSVCHSILGALSIGRTTPFYG